MTTVTQQTAVSATIERGLPFIGPVLALGAMLLVASTTTVATVMMVMG